MKKKSVEYTLKAEKKEFPIEKMNSSEKAYEYAKKFYFDDIEIYESVFVILVNRALNTIGHAKISQGGVSSSIVDARIVAKYAIESLCSGVILVHNHPSGNVRPSTEDNEMTKNIERCLSVFGISLLDHLIITNEHYYSYKDEGRL